MVRGPAWPAIQSQLGMDVATGAWIIGIYGVSNLVATLLLAKDICSIRASDEFLGEYVVFGLGFEVVVSAIDVTLLLFERAIQGFGAGGIYPVASAVVGDVCPVGGGKQGALFDWLESMVLSGVLVALAFGLPR